MESSSLLVLLEKVLTGRPGDAHKHSEALNKLHENLLVADEATLRAALLATRASEARGEINKVAANKFIDYLQRIKEKKKPIPPDLYYLTFSANPSSRRCSVLFHSLIKLSARRTAMLKSGLDSFRKTVLAYKNYKIAVYHKNQIKVQKCNSFVYVWMKNIKIKLEKALIQWKFFNKKSPKFVIESVMKKSELRYFYIKFLCMERWTNETWTVEVVDQFWGDDEVFHRSSKQRFRRPTPYDSFNNTRISEILYYMTNSATFMQNTEFDYRVQALSNLVVKQKMLRSRLYKVVKFMEQLTKLRKQMPITVLSLWNQKFLDRFEKLKKLELICEILSKKVSNNCVQVIRTIQQFNQDNFKEIIRKNLENLVKNSVKLKDSTKVVLGKMKMHQIQHFEKRVKYTKSVLTSVFKSTRNTQQSALSTWKLFKAFKSHTEKAKIVKRFIKSLASGLSKSTSLPLRFPDMIQRRESSLMRCVINSCKNLREILIISFSRWLKTNRSLISDRKKLKKLIIFSLNHITRNGLKSAIDRWREQQLNLDNQSLQNANINIRNNLKKKTLTSQRASALNLINALKSGGLSSRLNSAFRKIIDRTSDNYARKVISGIFNQFHKNLGKSLGTWAKVVRGMREMQMSRRMSEGNVLKSACNYLNVLALRRLKPFFKKWEDDLDKHKKKMVIDQIRSLKLIKLMKQVPSRFLRVSFNRIAKATNKIEQTLENLYYSMKRKPKHAFDSWRFNAIKSRKLMLLNKLRAEKLCRLMQKLPNKKLRRSFNSVVGTSIKIKHAMRNLLDFTRNRLKHRISAWKEYCSFCSHAELDLELRLHQFISILSTPIKKPLREGLNALKSARPDNLDLSSPIIPSDHSIVISPLILSRQEKPTGQVLQTLARRLRKVASSNLARWKAKAANLTCEQKFLNKLKGLQLSRILQALGRSTKRCTLILITNWKEKISRALTALAITYKARVRISFLKWKSFIDSEMRKGAVHMLKILKIRQAFERMLKRTLREASSRMMQGAVKMEHTMEGLVNGLKGIPRKAIRRWNKVIVEIMQEELLNNVRAHKMSSILAQVPKRTAKQVIKSISSIFMISSKLRLCLSNINRCLRKIPKESFDSWKKFCTDVRNRSIINDYNMQMVKNNLERIARRTIKDTLKLVVKKPKSIKKSLNLLICSLQKGQHIAFANWQNHIKVLKQNELIGSLKHKMLHSSLTTLLRKKLKDIYYRILGGGDKAKGTMQGMLTSLNKIPQKALKKWNRAVIEIREYELKSHIKASKLLHLMSKVAIRTLKDSSERIKGDIFIPKSIHGHLLNLYNIRKKRPKQAFDRWKKFCHIQDKNFLLDQLRQTMLQMALSKIASRVMRDGIQRIFGEGNKVKGAFFIYHAAMIRRPKNAFDKWKSYLFAVKHKGLLDNLRCFKLRNHFNRICVRKLRDATQRIIGGGDKIKGAIQNLVSGFRNIPAMALVKWNKYVTEVKERKLLDNFRSEKVKSKLSNLLLRSLRRTFKKICGDETTIAILKSMFRWLENIITTGPKTCFGKWKDLTTEAVKQRLRNTIKGQSLEKIFNRTLFKIKLSLLNKLLRPDKKIKQALSLCMKSARKKPSAAFNQLKSFSELSRRKGILNELASEKMKNVFENMVKKRLLATFKSMMIRNEKVVTAVSNIANHLRTKPKCVIQKWHRNVENLKKEKNYNQLEGFTKLKGFTKNYISNRKKQAFDSILQNLYSMNNTRLHCRAFNKLMTLIPRSALIEWNQKAKQISAYLKLCKIRGQQLQAFMLRIVKHKYRTYHNSSKNFYLFLNRLKSSFRNLNIFLNRKFKTNFGKWHKAAEMRKKLKIVQYLKSQKLQLALLKITNKVQKDALQRVIGQGDKAKGALLKLIKRAKSKPKPAFNRWKDFLRDITKKDLLQKLRGQRLKEIMTKVAKFDLKQVFNIICVDKGKIKTAINTVINNLTNKPRQVIKKWKAAVQYIREKALIDFFRGEKIQTFAERVVQRTRNDMFGRVTERKVKSWLMYLNLRWVRKILQQKPRNAFNKWKESIEDQRRKNLLSNIKSHKLVQCLGKASRKRLRDYVQRILGEGDKVKGAIKTVVSAIKTKTKEAFNSWQKQVSNLSRQSIVKNLLVQKFSKSLSQVCLRTMRDAVKRMVEEEDKVKLAINTVVINLQVKPRQVIKKWKQNIHLWREKILMKDVQSEKLRRSLQEICKRTSRKALLRITSVQNNSIIAGVNLKCINKILNKKPKAGFDNWKDYLNQTKQKELRDQDLREKLKNSFGRVPRRVFKASFQRILGEGSRAKGALKTIYFKISKWPQTAFAQWKKVLDDKSKNQMFNELRSSKLASVLNKLTARTKKSLLNPIIGKQERVKKIIQSLHTSLKGKVMQAFSKMNENIKRSKLEGLEKIVSGKKVQENLGGLLKTRCSKLFNSLKGISSNNGVRKLEKMMKIYDMVDRCKQGSAVSHWRAVSSKDKYLSKLIQAKGQMMKNTLSSAIRKTKFKSIQNIARIEKVLKHTFAKGEVSARSKIKQSAESWKKATFYSTNSKALRRYKAINLLSKVCNKKNTLIVKRIANTEKVFQAISNLIKSQQDLQRKAILAFEENKRKKQVIDKIQAIFKLYKVMKPKPKIMLKGRFEYWKNLEELRLYRLKKKVVMKWIYMSSVNYQNSFWKLKYVWNKTFKFFDPRHSLMQRKLSKIAANYQTRLKQYAHFKMVMYYKTMPYPIRRLSQKDQFQLTPTSSKRNSEHRALAFISRPENIAALSRAHTPVGYRQAFSRAFTPTGVRDKTPDRYERGDRDDREEDYEYETKNNYGKREVGKNMGYLLEKYEAQEQAKRSGKGNYIETYGYGSRANYGSGKTGNANGYEQYENGEEFELEYPKKHINRIQKLDYEDDYELGNQNDVGNRIERLVERIEYNFD